MWPDCPLYGTELFLMKVTASERGTPGDFALLALSGGSRWKLW